MKVIAVENEHDQHRSAGWPDLRNLRDDKRRTILARKLDFTVVYPLEFDGEIHNGYCAC